MKARILNFHTDHGCDSAVCAFHTTPRGRPWHHGRAVIWQKKSGARGFSGLGEGTRGRD